MRSTFLVIALLLTSLPASAVVIDGTEWRQLNETTGLTWDQVDSVCGTGTCVGSVNGINFDGWTWASSGDVGDMLGLLSGGAFAGGVGEYSEANSTWGPTILEQYFDPTFVWFTTYAAIQGWTSDETGPVFSDDPNSTLGGAAQVLDFSSTTSADRIKTDITLNRSYSDAGQGVWLFKSETSSVPAPSVAFILAFGFLYLIRARREVLLR